jgi:sugar lactone lactonase YvrE
MAEVRAPRDGLPADEPVGELEVVALFNGAMPTGVTVSHHGRRVFVCYPRWGDDVEFTVAEIREGREVPYPDAEVNRADGIDRADRFVSVQSVVVDALDRLWVLDTGSPMFRDTMPGGPKLVCVDLEADRVVSTIVLPRDVALPTTYLNDVRFDLGRGVEEEGLAFITDSSDRGPNGIIVVDLASGDAWRRLHDHPSTKADRSPDLLPVVEGRPFFERAADGSDRPVTMGSDGIALDAAGERLFYCPLMSRRLWSVSVDALADRALDDAAVAGTVRDEGDKGGGADGLEADADGCIYATSYEHDAILRRRPEGDWQTLVHDARLLWPDTMSLATDGYLYVTANQLHRQAKYQRGQDLRRHPYALFRIHVGTRPVLLPKRPTPIV